MEQRRHNTRHAAALAAAAALEDVSCRLSSGQPENPKRPPHSSSTSSSSSDPPSSASQSPLTVKPQQSPRKTPSPSHPSKMASKREMYEAFQAWALKTYGDSAKTKTVTRRKYNRILKILKGEEQTNAENSKFRFWVKAKGFRIGPPPSSHNSDFKRNDQLLYIPCSKIQVGSNGKEDSTIYKKVAVVENFFDIIYGVHVEMDGRGGKHAGQKRTYKAIAEMYSFLPREAVTHFLMSCADCQKRMHLAGGGNNGEGKGGTCSGASSNHSNLGVVADQQEDLSGGSELSSSPDDETELHIDYSLPITTTYLKHMRSLGYSEEDALNPDREDSEDAESEFSEDPQIPPVSQTPSRQQYDVPMEDENVEEQTINAKDAVEVSNAGPSSRPLDMRQIKQENGHMAWSLSEPINMTKGDLSNNHQDHSYERPMSPCNGCGKREASATPDNLSAGTKDEDDEDDDEDSDKIDINKYDPERLKAFNMFVRLFVDENLDRMVPISRQPKDKIQAIIDSCARQFPEFGERARKRIRTYLKSCRRNKRTRENSNWEVKGRSTHPHLTSALAEQILAAACENESQNAKRMRLGLKPIPAEVDRGRTSHVSHVMSEVESKTNVLTRSPQHENILQATLRHGRPPSSTATSILNGNSTYGQGSPTCNSSYRLVPNASASQSSSNGHPSTTPLTNVPTDLSMKKCGGPSDNTLKHSLNPGDVGQVKRLIASYRESAAFLARSADELEMLLLQQQQN